MGTIVGQGHEVSSVEEPHKAQRPVAESPQKPGSHVDGFCLDFCYLALETVVFLEDNSEVLDLCYLLNPCAIRSIIFFFFNG